MFVCVCHAVTDRSIREAASRGVATLDQLQCATGAGASCGCCRSMALQILQESQGNSAQMPAIGGLIVA
jgi:bacterioferritin-associated ferredoxin